MTGMLHNRDGPPALVDDPSTFTFLDGCLHHFDADERLE